MKANPKNSGDEDMHVIKYNAYDGGTCKASLLLDTPALPQRAINQNKGVNLHHWWVSKKGCRLHTPERE